METKVREHSAMIRELIAHHSNHIHGITTENNLKNSLQQTTPKPLSKPDDATKATIHSLPHYNKG